MCSLMRSLGLTLLVAGYAAASGDDAYVRQLGSPTGDATSQARDAMTRIRIDDARKASRQAAREERRQPHEFRNAASSAVQARALQRWPPAREREAGGARIAAKRARREDRRQHAEARKARKAAGGGQKRPAEPSQKSPPRAKQNTNKKTPRTRRRAMPPNRRTPRTRRSAFPPNSTGTTCACHGPSRLVPGPRTTPAARAAA